MMRDGLFMIRGVCVNEIKIKNLMFLLNNMKKLEVCEKKLMSYECL